MKTEELTGTFMQIEHPHEPRRRTDMNSTHRDNEPLCSMRWLDELPEATKQEWDEAQPLQGGDDARYHLAMGRWVLREVGVWIFRRGARIPEYLHQEAKRGRVWRVERGEKRRTELEAETNV